MEKFNTLLNFTVLTKLLKMGEKYCLFKTLTIIKICQQNYLK